MDARLSTLPNRRLLPNGDGIGRPIVGLGAKKWLRLGSIANMFFSLLFFLWAILNTILQDYGLDWGCLCFPVSFASGLAGLMASTHRSRHWTAIHAFLNALALGLVILIYGSTGFNTVFLNPVYAIPCWLWMVGLIVLNTTSSLSGAVDVVDPPLADEDDVAWAGRALSDLSLVYVASNTFFFVWAIINTYEAGQGKTPVHHVIDVGIVCFAVNAMCGMIGIYSGMSHDLTLLYLHRGAIPFGLVAVAVGYGMGFYHAGIAQQLDVSHVVFLIVTLVLWLVFGGLVLRANLKYDRKLNSSDNF